MSSQAQFLVNEAGEKTAVLLSIADYERLSRFEQGSRRPRPTPAELDEGYRRMAADTEAEAEALEWCEAMIGDVADDPHDLTLLEAAMIGAGLAQSDPERVHGTVCFVAAPRLPIDALFGNLDQGETIEGFLENYPDTIGRETIEAALAVQRRLGTASAAPKR